MIGETYELHEKPDKRQFVFLSEGQNGLIPKLVIYSKIGESIYNLGFGDVGMDGKIDDSVVSNNNDLLKIMNTVAKTIYIFTEHYPENQVYIEPVDMKRSNLYHTIFKRKWDEITSVFVVEGMIKPKVWEAFDIEKRYLAFRLTKI